jgi:hypothetical protein
MDRKAPRCAARVTGTNFCDDFLSTIATFGPPRDFYRGSGLPGAPLQSIVGNTGR